MKIILALMYSFPYGIIGKFQLFCSKEKYLWCNKQQKVGWTTHKERDIRFLSVIKKETQKVAKFSYRIKHVSNQLERIA